MRCIFTGGSCTRYHTALACLLNPQYWRNPRTFDAAQKKTRESLSLVSKRFEMSRYRRLATGSTNMPVWDELEKDPSKKPPRIVKRLDGKKPTRKRTTRIASKGEAPQRKKRKKS